MPRVPRKLLNANFFHVMSQGINKSYIFEYETDIKYYIKNMYEIKEKYNVKIIAYCIMNNHTHILLETNKIENLSQYMHCLNTRYGIYYNKKYQRVGYVFRDRYRAEGIYNENHLNNCIQYIYNNPVKAGICDKPELYPFSNYKENNMDLNGFSEDYNFLDIDENKKEICNIVFRKYLERKKVNGNDIKNNKILLEELVIILKDKYKISFRIMSEVLNINRDTIGKIYKKFCEKN